MNYKELMIRFFEGNLSREEEYKLFKWLEEDASHAQLFLQERKQYDLYLLSDTQLAAPVDVDAEYRKFQAELHPVAGSEKSGTRGLIPWARIASYAAVFAVAVLLTHFLKPFDRSEEPAPLVGVHEIEIPYITESKVEPAPRVYEKIETNKVNKKEIRLPDNTKVWINSRSELKYSPEFNGKLREVWLDGEAYFEVSHDPKRQFIVHTQEFDIKVYGTSFNVFAYNNYSNKSYTLLEGSIRLTSNVDPSVRELQIIPGQQVTFDAGKLSIKKMENPNLEISWREGKLHFRQKRFADICNQLEVAFNVEIKIVGDDLKNSEYTGDFVNMESIDEVLSVMSADERMEFRKDGNKIYIKEK